MKSTIMGKASLVLFGVILGVMLTLGSLIVINNSMTTTIEVTDVVLGESRY
ncbi:MAG: hypothetical protein RR475_02520 [Clostridia bacterium]